MASRRTTPNTIITNSAFNMRVKELKKNKFSDLETIAKKDIQTMKSMIKQLENLIVNEREKVKPKPNRGTRRILSARSKSRNKSRSKSRSRIKSKTTPLFEELVDFKDYETPFGRALS